MILTVLWPSLVAATPSSILRRSTYFLRFNLRFSYYLTKDSYNYVFCNSFSFKVSDILLMT